MLKLNSSRSSARFLVLALVALSALLLSSVAFGQTTVATGSIQGSVTDPTGAVISGARVTITHKSTGQVITTSTNSAGAYTSGSLIPGDYVVRVEAKGFSTTETQLVIQVGVTATGNVKLQVGQGSTVVEVQGSAISVNTEQATVQGVLNTDQIENLPVNGRNFLDLAQLEPGVQIQEGSTFDPTKNGFSSISFGGRFGRTARIEVDGVDVSDETVGTTTQNIPASSIQEFQLSSSSLDMSTELTSSGSVNVVTRSGTNAYHGELFGYYRNSSVGMADLPGGSSNLWTRQQFGGNFGGAIIKDKLFFFVDGERNKQNLNNPVEFGGPFVADSPNVGEPFRELETSDRLDYQLTKSARMFYRFSYDQNSDVRPFGAGPSAQPFLNHTNTPSHALGVDFNTGSFTHTIRFEYLKFRNGIANGASEVTGAANPIPDATINIGGGSIAQCEPGSFFCSGPNLLAPQQTYQSDHQIKYDGSHIIGSHILRYGGSFNHILGGGFASFFALSPTLSDDVQPSLTTGDFTDPNPLDYPVEWAFIGNGQGFATEVPQFGFPAGGQHDNRFGFYGGDSWKIKPNFTLTYGLRWVKDTGRTDSDLAAIPALNQWGAGLGDKVRDPGKNFGPQVGFAWDVSHTGRTVIRGGAGIYYENAIFNNVLFDRPARLATGSFLSTPLPCLGGSAGSITWPSNPGPIGTLIGTGGIVSAAGIVSPYDPASVGNNAGNGWCGESIGTAAPLALNLEQTYQAATTSAGPASNPSFIGNPGAYASPNSNGLGLIAPNYQTPRSVQMNIGIQHQIRPGLVFTGDFIRNVSTRTLLGIDVNHGGDVSTFNAANAATARDSVQTANGCPTGPGEVGCVITALGSPSAALSAYGGAGIGEPAGVTGGPPCPFCAFPGYNPNVGVNVMLFPEGRSVYNGMDLSLKQQANHLGIPGVKSANFQASYSLSRYVSQAADSDFVNTAGDYLNPDRFTGPNALDRTQQFSFGGFFDLPLRFRVGLIGHFDSPLPQSILLPNSAGGAAGILVTDVTGDGTIGDPVPGTQIGQYMRGISPTGLGGVINRYNTTNAGQPTPAGSALINGGIFTLADLQSMGGVQQPLAPIIANPAALTWLKSFDLNIGWSYRIKEHVTIEPTVGIFNIFNFANFDLPGNEQGGILNLASSSVLGIGSATQQQGTIGGTNSDITSANFRTNRASLQSGTNGLGAPRAIEWGLKISF
jgi:hypothetical protein